MNAHGLSSWLATHARPLPLDPAGPPVAVPEALAQADVAGLASSVRSARELVLATHVLLRALVEQAGFRALFIEGTDETAPALDRFVRTGEGDPAALLATSQSFLRMHEALAVIRWLRSWCQRHPDDAVSIVHDLEPPASPPGSLVEMEEDLARRELLWRTERGQRIVHWGGTAHVIAGDPRTVPPDQTHRNAGGILRAELGHRYAVAALTLGSGSAPFRIPPPPSDYTEHALTGVRHDAALLELDQPGNVPRSVTDWLHLPLRTRMIGPTYDPTHDHDFRVDAGPLHHCVDVLVHLPGSPLPTPCELLDHADHGVVTEMGTSCGAPRCRVGIREDHGVNCQKRIADWERARLTTCPTGCRSRSATAPGCRAGRRQWPCRPSRRPIRRTRSPSWTSPRRAARRRRPVDAPQAGLQRRPQVHEVRAGSCPGRSGRR